MKGSVVSMYTLHVGNKIDPFFFFFFCLQILHIILLQDQNILGHGQLFLFFSVSLPRIINIA